MQIHANDEAGSFMSRALDLLLEAAAQRTFLEVNGLACLVISASPTHAELRYDTRQWRIGTFGPPIYFEPDEHTVIVRMEDVRTIQRTSRYTLIFEEAYGRTREEMSARYETAPPPTRWDRVKCWFGRLT